MRGTLGERYNGSRYAGVNALSLSADLRREIRDGEARFDLGTRAIYAHDSSNFRQVPLGVVLPKSKDEVMTTVRVCRDNGAPVLMRGCGTSLSGETVNAAVIIDTSKYMREIIEVDPDRRIARVQPGVVRDQLRDWVVMAAGPSADSRGGA